MSFGMGKQSSKQSQSSGLDRPQRTLFSGWAPAEFGYARSRARAAEADPAGLAYRNVVDQMLPTGPYGLPYGATEGVYQLGRDLMSQYSGTRAQRGFNSPMNLEGVLGDAVRMAAPQLIPLSTNYALQRAQIAPALRQASFGYAQSPFEMLQSILSGSSSGKGSSSGWGFNFGLGEAGTKALMSGGAAAGTSDRRLKSNIVRIGKHPLGIGWYEYDIDGRHEQGVMADEVLQVKPEAVSYRPDGYMMVDYNMIGRVG